MLNVNPPFAPESTVLRVDPFASVRVASAAATAAPVSSCTTPEMLAEASAGDVSPSFRAKTLRDCTESRTAASRIVPDNHGSVARLWVIGCRKESPSAFHPLFPTQRLF